MIGSAIINKLTNIYTKQIEYREGDYYFYAHYQDLLPIPLEIKDNCVEFHSSDILDYVSGRVVRMLCNKYGILEKDDYKNHCYIVVDTLDEIAIKAKVGKFLTAVMSAYIFNERKEIIETYKNEEEFIMSRYSKISLDMNKVKNYLSENYWAQNIKDIEKGFEVETVLADEKGKPFKVLVTDEDTGVYVSTNHNYKKLLKMKDIESVLGYFYCEYYEKFNRFECQLLSANEIKIYIEFIISVLLIAENIPAFQVAIECEE